MKRNGGIFTFLTIFLSSLVRAGPVEGLEQLARGAIEMIEIIIYFISNTLFRIDSFDEFLFAKILIFVLILIITYTVIKENRIFGGKKNRGIQWIIASSISILAVRYLPNNFVEAILLQYSALAVAITVLLPLMIYFFFIHQSGIGITGRKAGWIAYGAVFVGLWISRYKELGEANLVYWIGIAAIAISLLFDKRIHRYFGLSSFRAARKRISDGQRVEALNRLNALAENRTKGFYNGKEKEYEKLKEDLEQIVKDNT